MPIEICTASAGSGKTFLLAKNYLRILLQAPGAEAFARILAVTFTNKATEEMKTRILDNLRELADQSPKARTLSALLQEETGLSEAEIRLRSTRALKAILHNYARFSVRTLDMFFQRIFRSFVLEAGLGPDFTVDLDLDHLLARTVDRLLEHIQGSGAENHLRALVLDKVRRGGGWSFRKTLLDQGKRAMQEDFLRLPASFHAQLTQEGAVQALLKTFHQHRDSFEEGLKAYALRIWELWEAHGITAEDFYGKGRSPIYNGIWGMAVWDKKTVQSDPITHCDKLFAKFFDLNSWCTKALLETTPFLNIWEEMMDLGGQMEDFYNEHLPQYATARAHLEPRGFLLIPYLVRELQALEEEEGNRYIGQTTLLLSQLVKESDTPFVYEKTGSFYNSFLLDEFQDTSLLQWETLRPLLLHTLSQSRVPSLVVGDVKQSIYRWRNGDWTILAERLPQELGRFKPRHSRLEYNYRSAAAVVDFNNRLYPALLQELEEGYGDTLAEGGDPETPTYAARLQQVYGQAAQLLPPGKEGEPEGFVQARRVWKEDLAGELTSLVADLQDRGFRPKDILILVRSHSQGQKVQEILMAHKREHPQDPHVFEITSVGTQVLGQVPYIQLCIAMFTCAVHPSDRLSEALVARWVERLGPETGVEAPPPADFYPTLALGTLPEALEQVIRFMHWQHHAPALPYLQELYDCLLDSPPRRGNDLYSFLQWWDEVGARRKLESENSANVLRLMTIHKAKGLQAPVVIVPFCEGDLVTYGQVLWVPSRAPFNALDYLPLMFGKFLEASPYQAEYHQELFHQLLDRLNLVYVALTRAQRELHLMIGYTHLKKKPDPQEQAQEELGKLPSTLDSLMVRALNRLMPEGKGVCWQWGTSASPETASPAAANPEAPSPAAANPARKTSANTSMIYKLEDFGSAPLTEAAAFRWKEAPQLTPDNPRLEGIVLHRAFSRIFSRADILPVLDTLAAEGLFLAEPQRIKAFETLLREALDHPQAGAWFDGSWRVRNEAAILLPGTQAGPRKYRPDRVMEKDGRVVVVDYKFGDLHLGAYRQQLAAYAQALRQMGHPVVEAYLWYVREGLVERVEG